MWRARALVATVPLLAAVAALLMGAHPEPEAQALPARPAQLVATTTSTTTTSTTVAPTTTTTSTTVKPPSELHKPAIQAQKIKRPAAVAHEGWPCGGDLPPCWVLHRENPQGDPAVYNGGCHAPPGYTGPGPCGSTASGLWQFLRSTWARFGGYVNAADAPPEVQNAKARELWAGGRGCSHWSAC